MMNRNGLVVVSALLHLYIGARLVPSLIDRPVAASVMAGVLVLSAIAIPLGMMFRRRSGRLYAALQWIGLVMMGFFSSLLVLTVLRDLALLLASVIGALVPGAIDVDDMTDVTAIAAPLLALFATIVGYWNARRTAAVIRVDIPIENLPRALEGFTIAQISDVHVGPTIKGGYLTRIVDKVNRLSADMVAVTGDLVDGSVRELGRHVAALAQLRSKHGTFFVTGNHEYYSGAPAWIRELGRLGVHVLVNEHVVLTHRHEPLVIAGVTDPSAHHFIAAHRSDPVKAMEGAPADAICVLLAHQPRSAEAAADAGFHLQLSGHTHGGQFWPWNHFVRLQQPFTAGLRKLRNLWVYTSRGTGYWGPPKRFGAPSEITALRLVRA